MAGRCVEERSGHIIVQTGVGRRCRCASRIELSEDLLTFGRVDVSPRQSGQRLREVLRVRGRALEPELQEHAPIGAICRGYTRLDLPPRHRHVLRYRPGARHHRAPFVRRSELVTGRRRHPLNLPVDPAKRLIDIGVESPLLVAQHLVLVQQEIDLGQHDAAVDAAPRRERARIERCELPPKFTQP